MVRPMRSGRRSCMANNTVGYAAMLATWGCGNTRVGQNQSHGRELADFSLDQRDAARSKPRSLS